MDLFPAGLDAFLLHILLLSHGFLEGAWRAELLSPSTCLGVCAAPAPGAQPSALRVPLSLDFALHLLTHHVLLAPRLALTVVPVIVSLWLFIGHSPPVSSFYEGKRPQPGAGGGGRGGNGPRAGLCH